MCFNEGGFIWGAGPGAVLVNWCDDRGFRGGVPTTGEGLVWTASSEWASLRHAANFAMVALQAASLGVRPEEARGFAARQVHYALGDTGRSFVCGFGTNPPLRPHHR